MDENSDNDAPLNLVVTKSPSIEPAGQKFMILGLRTQNTGSSTFQMPPNEIRGAQQSSMHQTRQHRPVMNVEVDEVALSTPGSKSQAEDVDDDDVGEDYTADDMDPDWLPDRDATLMNELSIYEYFEKFKNDIFSDHDTDASSVAEDQETERRSNKQTKENSQPKKSKFSLRRRNKDLKERRLAYERIDGTVVAARRVKPPCNCRMRCYDKFSEPIRTELLSKILELSQSGQNQFLSNHITVIDTVRPRVRISNK